MHYFCSTITILVRVINIACYGEKIDGRIETLLIERASLLVEIGQSIERQRFDGVSSRIVHGCNRFTGRRVYVYVFFPVTRTTEPTIHRPYLSQSGTFSPRNPTCSIVKKIALSDIENVPNPLQVHEVRKPISMVLGTTDFAMNYFELQSGESFSGGTHTHHDQEEVFFIMEGTATFEVGPEGSEEVEVGPREAIRFEPGDFQYGYNNNGEQVVGLALGAPGSMHNWDDLESITYCPECEEETSHSIALDGARFELTCNECGFER